MTFRSWRSTKSLKKRGYNAHPLSLGTFGLYVNDRKMMGVDWPLKGFSQLSLSISPAGLLALYREIFKENNMVSVPHYWPDTSFFLESGSVWGQRNGEYLRLSDASFINACAAGLTGINQKYDLLWKKFNELKRLHVGELEKIIHREDVTIIHEVGKEFTEGDERRGSVRITALNDAYKKRWTSIFERKRRLAKKMGEAQAHDETLAMLRNNGIGEVIARCIEKAEKCGIQVSKTDNALVAYALANLARCSNEPQIILTQDQGIVDLARHLSHECADNFKFDIQEKYHRPLRMHELEIRVA